MSKIFSGCDYLGRFELMPGDLVIPEEAFFKLDETIREHIRSNKIELRDHLIAQTEFLSTYLTAKAEEINTLSKDEARDILKRLHGTGQDETAPLSTRSKGLDAQEYKNIVRGYQIVSESVLSAKEFSVDRLKELHRVLTDNLDTLSYGIGGSGPAYNSGELRNAEVWIGGMFSPAKPHDIEQELQAAIAYYQDNQTIADTFIFSLAVYAIHPFNNGNKRVCRIMEHGLLRSLGINKDNIYSHITETYRDLDKHKHALKESLGGKVLNHFVSYQLESLYKAQMQKRNKGLKQENN